MTPETDELPVEVSRPPVRERISSPAGKIAIGVGGVVLVMTALLLVFGAWWPNLLPITASDTQDAVKTTILVFAISAAPVMALVWGIAYYSLRHWRRGSGETPPEDGPALRANNRIAIGWLVASSVLTAFLLIWGLSALASTTTLAAGAKPEIIEVTGQQWLWSFSYPEDGGVSSASLVLPKDRPVVFKVTSTDVIHSFWLPEMGIKVDANPSVITTVSTTPTLLGTFNVRCAELCGLNHSYMQTTARVVSADDFDAWVKSEGGVPGQSAPAGGSNG